MTLVCIFDVDGTLTPARQAMDEKFAKFFREFITHVPTYLISGSDYSKLEEQVPQDILQNCNGVFGSSGSQYFEAGKEVFSKDHKFKFLLHMLCEDFVDLSDYQIRRGNHIEKRPGMLNVSVIGRNASLEDRKHYSEWDKRNNERAKFVDVINKSRLPYEASAGGEISIDIVPNGWNKSTAMPEVLDQHPNANVLFFGDKIDKGGNDKPLADALNDGSGKHRAYPVNDYTDTWQYLAIISEKYNKVAA